MKLVNTYRLFALALVALIISLGLYFSGYHGTTYWILGTVSLLAALPLIKSMWEDIRSGSYGIDLLALTAIIASVILKQDFTAIIIVIMLTGGRGLEDYAGPRARSELDALLKGSPHRAHVIRGRKTLDIPARDVKVGDRIIIKPGELVPVDAVILEGSSTFNESSLTGESLPVDHGPNDQILSGSVNNDSLITAKTIRRAEDSQYQQIIQLVKSAAASQAPFVRLADRYSVPFTVAAYIIAIAAWIIGHQPIRFLEVIVVATPCPLLLAAPIALISGMSRASRYGIIVKTGSALERLAESRAVIFDKTGTLTIGHPSIDSIQAFKPYTQAEVLSLAASIEQNSNHVIAQAIVQAASDQKLKLSKVKQAKETAGLGLNAAFKGNNLLIGRAEYLSKHGIAVPESSGKQQAKTIVYLAINNKLAGTILLSDQVRPETKDVIRELTDKLGINQTAMVTGDNQATAEAIAKTIGMTTVYAEALPGEKLQALEDIKEKPVAFVGDGVNDAPALAAADVGIAMGARGSTAASESADLVIMTDDLRLVSMAVRIAQRTFAIARQSILVGIGMSLVLMLIFATGKFPPVYGAIIQELVDVVVIFNALRVHSIKLQLSETK